MNTPFPALAGLVLATAIVFSMPVLAAPQTAGSTGEASAQMTRAEHEAAAARYEQEAVQLRAKSAQHADTARQHAARTGPRGLSQQLQRHCERLAANYAEAAKEAEDIAKLHRELAASQSE